jgi:hypothetical protein
MRTRGGWLALGLVLVTGATSQAYFLDKGRNFDVRLRAYTQLGILTEDSSDEASGSTLPAPEYEAGDLAQHRNFYNPEFDARLTDYVRWMHGVPGVSALAPDEFKFRFAWWGFYDGLYDYLDERWADHLRGLKARYSSSDEPEDESFVFNDEYKRARAIYAHRNRINELYLDYTKGPVFLRVGRQAISWGESDSIALLDVQNPFDLTQGAPGFFQDVDEARIPLWTLRGTVKLLDNWKWLSSVFLDAYVVPGPIDTTVPINPLQGGVSGWNPDVRDPQEQAAGQVIPGPPGKPARTVHVVTVDRLPQNDWSNSRWGARLTGLLLRDYTVQGWFFRTFNQAPVPILASPGGPELGLAGALPPTQIDDRGRRTPVCNGIDAATGFGRTPAGRACSLAFPAVTVLDRRLESVIGVAATWFSQPVNGIIRTEMEYFLDEIAFIPKRNVNPRSQLPPSVLRAVGGTGVRSSMPTADFLRFVVGYDRFFFFRPLNPANSFTLSMAFNGSYNLSEDGDTDYRNPNPKPGRPVQFLGRVPGIALCDNIAAAPAAVRGLCIQTRNQNFEDLNQFEGFLQTALLTDYWHGRLSPRIVIITDISGIFGFAPSVTYRFSDSLLASVNYLAIAASREAGLGTFRDHDTVQLRVTYQLN